MFFTVRAPQKRIASHESNGIDIIIDLVKGDFKLMEDEHSGIAMKLKVWVFTFVLQ